ncbi:MAG: hypothetical protein SGILL_008073, partial [Bacillariaceae sp.]
MASSSAAAAAAAVTTPYFFCTRDEIEERQELQQISELEATLETCHLPQAKRILDPSLAVAKYRRSAAGMDNDKRDLRSPSTLMITLQHLIGIGATFRASEKHPRVTNVETVVNFVVDRLRACQSDATRLNGDGAGYEDDANDRNDTSSSSSSFPAEWHVQATRLLVWLQYLSSSSSQHKAEGDSLLPRTIHTMRSTAYDAYWSQREVEAASLNISGNVSIATSKYALDDEMLCYAAMFRIA